MAISFELAAEVERHLREELSDLDNVAKESALVGFIVKEGSATTNWPRPWGWAGWSWITY